MLGLFASLVPGLSQAQPQTVSLDPAKMKVEVQGDRARLHVHDAPQPTLLVDGLKQGPTKGAIALWIGPGTIAHFSNLRLSK